MNNIIAAILTLLLYLGSQGVYADYDWMNPEGTDQNGNYITITDGTPHTGKTIKIYDWKEHSDKEVEVKEYKRYGDLGTPQVIYVDPDTYEEITVDLD